MRTILLVEDDESLGETLTDRLVLEGYQVHWAKTCAEARTNFDPKKTNVCIIDIGLPDGSGFSIAREFREKGDIPIIFLTAMNSAEYRLEGFEIGAADYIPKPFHLKELLLRLVKVLGSDPGDVIRKSGNLELDPTRLKARWEETPWVQMNQREFDLLLYLVAESPRIVSRAEILEKVFRLHADTTPRVVDNIIVKIRALLPQMSDAQLRSVRGQGYQWVS